MKQKLPPSYNTYRPYAPANLPPQPVAPKTRHSIRNTLIFLICFGLLGWLGYSWVSKHVKAIASPSTQPATVVIPQYPSVAPVLDPKITSLIAAHPELDITVSSIDLKTGKLYHYGLHDPFEAASTAKLLTACLFLHQVETGVASLDQNVGGLPAQTQLKKMIQDSDNTAWDAFNNGTLGHSALQAYANQIDLTDYKADGNTIEADDLAHLLEQLYNGKLLNKQHTNQLLTYMANTTENDYIPAAVPAGIKVYHKAGWLKDRVHDAAIIDNGKRPYVLVIFTKARGTNATYDTTVGLQLFHDITTVTITAYGS